MATISLRVHVKNAEFFLTDKNNNNGSYDPLLCIRFKNDMI